MWNHSKVMGTDLIPPSPPPPCVSETGTAQGARRLLMGRDEAKGLVHSWDHQGKTAIPRDWGETELERHHSGTDGEENKNPGSAPTPGCCSAQRLKSRAPGLHLPPLGRANARSSRICGQQRLIPHPKILLLHPPSPRPDTPGPQAVPSITPRWRHQHKSPQNPKPGVVFQQENGFSIPSRLTAASPFGSSPAATRSPSGRATRCPQ